MLLITRGHMDHWPDLKKMLPRVWKDDYVQDSWCDWVQHPQDGLTVVALWQGKAVGTSYIAYRSPELVWFQGLRVDPDFQGRGIAGAMNRFAIEELRKAGYKRGLAAIDEDNLPSQKVTLRSGFHQLYTYVTLGAGNVTSQSTAAPWVKIPLSATDEYLSSLRSSLRPPRDMVLLAWSLHFPEKTAIISELAFEGHHFFYGWSEGMSRAWAGIYDFEEQTESNEHESPIVMSPACNDPHAWPSALASLEAMLRSSGRTLRLWLSSDDPLYAATLSAGYSELPDEGYQIWEILF